MQSGRSIRHRSIAWGRSDARQDQSGRSHLGIVFRSAIVVSENLLIDVAVKVERLHGHIGSLQSPFEQAPEVFQSVRMNPAIHT
jgi:hypothetical protein